MLLFPGRKLGANHNFVLYRTGGENSIFVGDFLMPSVHYQV